MGFVQAAVSIDPVSAATTVSVTITAGIAGNHILGNVSWQTGTNDLSNVKDNNGVTYTIQDVILDPANTTSCASFYKENISGAPTSIIATFSVAESARIGVIEWSGLAASSSLDAHNGSIQTAVGTVLTLGSITPTVPGDLLFGFASCDTAGSTTLVAANASDGTVCTLRNAGTGGENHYDETGIQAAAGAVQMKFTAGTAGQTYVTTTMAFKAAVSANVPALAHPIGFKTYRLSPFLNRLPPTTSPPPNIPPGIVVELEEPIRFKPFTRAPFLSRLQPVSPPTPPTVDTPTYFIPRTYPPQQALTQALLQNTAQDFSSSAVETNPHWQGRTYPAQWNISRAFLNQQHIAADPAIETNPHWQARTWAPQWVTRQQNSAADVPVQVAADDPTYVALRTFPVQWTLNLALRQNTANDFSSLAVDDPTYVTFRTFPVQWALNRALGQNTAQDFSSSAVETNPHWVGQPWSTQWLVNLSLSRGVTGDTTTVVTTPDAPPPFAPRTWLPQWVINIPLHQNTAQDFSSSAVETNVHSILRTWPVQWMSAAALWQNPATDVLIIEDPSYFTPRTWPIQWIVSKVLWQTLATDAPILVDTPAYFVPRQLPPQWNLSRAFGQNIAADFSSMAVETNVQFIPHPWPLQWSLQTSLMRGTAQDFSSVAPVVTSRPRVYFYT